jgi:hypothetical protein
MPVGRWAGRSLPPILNRRAVVHYTVSCGGVVIGATELDFVRTGGPSRAGWFHPNAEGERLLPLIVAPLAMMRAYLDRKACDEGGGPLVRPELIGSAAFADVAEAFQRAEAHRLTLHRADGSLVPTRMLGLQDTEQLLALAEWEEARRDARPWTPDDEDDEHPFAVDEDDDDDVAALLGGDPRLDGDPTEPGAGWAPDDEPTEFPRYQIILELADADAIP